MGSETFDETVDVLVVGSGAGGMTAALAAVQAHGRVLVIEKSEKWGGTSATSGGGIWIPNSHIARAAGHEDSEAEAFDYLRPQSLPNVPDEQIRAFIRRAPEMLKWLQASTPIRYEAMAYPDYRAEMKGGKTGFRTHLPGALDGRLLGKDILTLRAASPAASLFGIINWRFEETYALLFRPKGWTTTLAKMIFRYVSDLPHRFRSSKDRNLTLGNALCGGLRIALNEHQVPFWLDTELKDIVVEGGRVTGAVVIRQGKLIRIATKRGLVLAAGGFERDKAMRARFLKGSDDPTFSGSQINNTGDSIRAANRAGAALRNMHSTWAAPVFRVPGEARARLSTVERALPGCIIVNQAGKRYMNEAISYHDAGMEMADKNHPGASTQPSWVIFDATFRHKYPMGPLLPLVPDLLQPRGVRRILRKASSIIALGTKIGVPANTLEATVARFNSDVAQGRDSEFGRGDNAYDRMYGDYRVQPNPSLAPIVRRPFYAFPIYSGDIGTNGGIVTNENGQAMDANDRLIDGLYAVGNNAASPMGQSYPGAGVTLGPAMTFGYVAGRHAMGVNS